MDDGIGGCTALPLSKLLAVDEDTNLAWPDATAAAEAEATGSEATATDDGVRPMRAALCGSPRRTAALRCLAGPDGEIGVEPVTAADVAAASSVAGGAAAG
eukprot:SAG22_NODE_9247_length_601_cov_0.573705_1_plen_100_part_01